MNARTRTTSVAPASPSPGGASLPAPALMIATGATADAGPAQPSSDAAFPARHRAGRLRSRTAWLLGGAAVLGSGLALNWSWLTAVGAAPVILSLAPCALMCTLGICCGKGGDGS